MAESVGRQNAKMSSMLNAANELDQRRQEQIKNQVQAINRLLGRLFSIANIVNRPLGTTSLAGDNAAREDRYNRVRELVDTGLEPGYNGVAFVIEDMGAKLRYTVDSAAVQDNGELVITLKPVTK